MKIGQLPYILESAYLAEDSVLVSGVHGIGKSEIIKNYADSKGFYCEDLFLSLMDESDIQGIPYIENRVERFAEPPFIYRINEAAKAGRPSILFLDEINRASKYVQAAVFELILNGRVNEHSLPITNGKKTLIVAAVNPSQLKYQTSDLDPALMDRFCLVDVEVDVQSWLKWAQNKVHPTVVEFIQNNPNTLHLIDKAGMGPTPRSWVKLSDHLKNFDKIDNSVHFNIMEGRVGTPTAVLFHNFYNESIKFINVQDIIEFVQLVNKNKGITEDTIKLVSSELRYSFLTNVDVIVQHNVANQLIDKLVHKKATREEIMPALVFLYSLRTETRTGLLKQLKLENNSSYLVLSKLDFNKDLFRSGLSSTINDISSRVNLYCK